MGTQMLKALEEAGFTASESIKEEIKEKEKRRQRAQNIYFSKTRNEAKLTLGQQDIVRHLAEGSIARVKRLPESVGPVIRGLEEELKSCGTVNDRSKAIKALIDNLRGLKWKLEIWGHDVEERKTIVERHKFPYFPRAFEYV